MLTKEKLKKEFSQKADKYYSVKLFKEQGFVRKHCKCGNNFWTLDPDRETCPNPPCQNYDFIGKPITRGKWDYIQTWKLFEKFFVQNGHTSVKRYPVVDRWRPDLYFTIASIQDFQRIDQGQIVMEYPADPLIVPQVCLRFPDIPNVGVTGRHHTCFIMPGQHAFGSYWKDRCIELNFNFLHKIMGIPQEEIVYIEDMWAMPDFSQFGPSLETFSKGLELVNSVFSQYTKAGSSYKELPKKVIDVGWGHERLVWFSNGTSSGYDSAFGPVIGWLRKQTGLQASSLLDKYSKLAGGLTYDEVEDIKKVRQKIASKLGVSVKHLNSVVEPMQALYAIADHTKALLFAVTDSGIPSNVGGGYNLRVILRRALSFMQEFGFTFDLVKVAELHARFLRPMFPELQEGLTPLKKILDIESMRYKKTMAKAEQIVSRQLKGVIDTPTLIKLYTSNGIAPELIQKIARKQKSKFKVPDDFYSKLTKQHLTGKKEFEQEKLKVDVTGLPKTKLLYYSHPNKQQFWAKAIKRIGDWIVLDQTLFYTMGGGQPSDSGILEVDKKSFPVKDVRKVGNVVLHLVKGPKAGQQVQGKLDWERRWRLMQMHTATHVVAGAARHILGQHIWQAGAQKGTDSSRIDLTHYKAFTPTELNQIEQLANKTVKQAILVDSRFLPRSEAENTYGFVIYQGGASPGVEVRIVKIGDFDVEACGGTHLKNTKDIELIKIIRTERIQDGINRIEFTCGEVARTFIQDRKNIFKEVLANVIDLPLPKQTIDRFLKQKANLEELTKAVSIFSVEPVQLPQTIKKFSKKIIDNSKLINKLEQRLSLPKKPLQQVIQPISKTKSLTSTCQAIFECWKTQEKELEKLRKILAKDEADKLIKKAKKGKIFEIVPLSRDGLIELASELLRAKPRLTVILANQTGDIIGMSKIENISRIIKKVCTQAGGSGGGSPRFAQGKVQLSKLLKIIEKS